jgi:hypothetical protein
MDLPTKAPKPSQADYARHALAMKQAAEQSPSYRNSFASVDGVPRFALTPDDAATATGFSRTRIFEAIRDEDLCARKSGKATVIEVTEIARWLRTLPTKGRKPEHVAVASVDRPEIVGATARDQNQ